MREYYELLGLDESATDAEILARYEELRAKYSEERWLDGEAGNHAARMLTKLETARFEIMESRKQHNQSTEGESSYEEIAALLKDGNVNEAQARLDDFNERGAEWHYLQAVVFYRKNWMNESKKQLEIAVSMDGANPKYQKALQDLNRKMQMDQQRVFTSGNAAYGGQPYGAGHGQMGGDTLSNCCTTYLCCQALSCFCR